MIRKNKLPELLAPAGDFECLLAAVEGGADAVYVGGKSFGARAFAKNFTDEELRLAVIYCHRHRAIIPLIPMLRPSIRQILCLRHTTLMVNRG